MKYLAIILFFVFAVIDAFGQKPDTAIHLLKPSDWQLMSCGKSPIWKETKETLLLVNETNKSIQGYWISHTNLIQKQRRSFVKANQSTTLNVRAGEYWIICDSANNALGVFQILSGKNKIIINESDFEETHKLPSNIIDRSYRGSVSGGQAIQEQIAYDVIHYDIKMEVFPDERYIKASNTISALATQRLNCFVFDLDTLLEVKKVVLKEKNQSIALKTIYHEGKYWCKLPKQKEKGEVIKVYIEYEGMPRSATHAPYQGGFSWNKTEDCQHWIATSCQIDGADLWFPCKDFQWDEPDSVKLTFTVPKGLKAISNGVLTDVGNNNQTSTFTWNVSNPINNYSIALNIAPYIELKDAYVGLYDDSINISYWFLPENEIHAKQLYPNVKNYLNFLENTIGPYPFRNEKLGIIEVPFVGMEHQTIIAFGPDFTEKYPGYNYVLFHELCHEWFGNMVTAHNWSDFWIQEALTGYTEALYEEYLQGEAGYKKKMELRRNRVKNKIPLTTDSVLNSREAFNDFSYAKSVYLIHSLRYLIGKERILKVLRLMAYPDKQSELKTNGQQCRFVNTNDFFSTIEKVCNKNYNWFKDVYFKNAEVPLLVIQQTENTVVLEWETKNGLPFNMPLEIKTKDGVEQINFTENIAKLNITRDAILEIDPNKWLLFDIKE